MQVWRDKTAATDVEIFDIEKFVQGDVALTRFEVAKFLILILPSKVDDPGSYNSLDHAPSLFAVCI